MERAKETSTEKPRLSVTCERSEREKRYFAENRHFLKLLSTPLYPSDRIRGPQYAWCNRGATIFFPHHDNAVVFHVFWDAVIQCSVSRRKMAPSIWISSCRGRFSHSHWQQNAMEKWISDTKQAYTQSLYTKKVCSTLDMMSSHNVYWGFLYGDSSHSHACLTSPRAIFRHHMLFLEVRGYFFLSRM